MKAIVPLLWVLVLSACGGEADSSDAGSAGDTMPTNGAEDATFQVTDSLGGGFDDESPRARVRFVTNDMIELSARGGLVRLHTEGLPAGGVGTTSTFLRNNTLYTATLEIDGASKQVGCSPGDPIVATLERSFNNGEQVSGRFEVEFAECSDYISGEPIELPGLPMTVTGVYDRLPLDR
jgi:hypothetical protein